MRGWREASFGIAKLISNHLDLHYAAPGSIEKERRCACIAALVEAHLTMQFQRRPRLYAAARLRQIVLKPEPTAMIGFTGASYSRDWNNQSTL
jgi:hypothetical protein